MRTNPDGACLDILLPELYIIEPVVEVPIDDTTSLEISVHIARDRGGDTEQLTIGIETTEGPLDLGQVNDSSMRQ